MFSTKKSKLTSGFLTIVMSFLITFSLLPATFAAASSEGHSSGTNQEHPADTIQENSESEGHGHGTEENKVEVQQGNYQIQFITPENMFEGENEIQVVITQENKPAQSLAVKLLAEMDESDSSMNMNHGEEDPPIEQLLSEVNPGEYSGTINFEGDGQWLLSVQFLDQKTTLEVLVERSGPNWLVIGGFLGVIFAIILTAGILKHTASKEGIKNVS